MFIYYDLILIISNKFVNRFIRYYLHPTAIHIDAIHPGTAPTKVAVVTDACERNGYGWLI